MEKELNLKSFVFPGCIEVCIGSSKLPVIARIYKDRSIAWERKRITDKMREYVESLAKTPFIAISFTQNVNFFNK